MHATNRELTDSQWEVIEKLLDDQRKRWHPLREIVNAFLSINRTGAQWRELDSKYPPWQSVYYHFRQFKLRGIWEQLLDSLVVKDRVSQKRQETPSLLAIDSQLVKIMAFVKEQTGIDGSKCINRRKRSMAVDRLGLPWALAVTWANTSDNEAGKLVLDRLKGKVPHLKVIAADQGYKVRFIEYAQQKGWHVEIAQKPESAKGLVPQKDRWPVERSFAWLNFRRRLFRDVEKTIESSEAMLQIAFISFLLNRST